nr:unnamed protein product [Spirometra erinaceieuropaei]
MSSDAGEHLTKGDVEPTVDPDKITLYEMHLCPFCQRVRYTLDYHEIPYDRILISVGSKPDWFLNVNPRGMVPLLLHHGQNMIDSEAIMKYVDQLKGPENSLLRVCGEEGFQKALDLSSSIAGHRSKLCFSVDATKDDVDFFKTALSNVDKEIKGPYLLVSAAVPPPCGPRFTKPPPSSTSDFCFFSRLPSGGSCFSGLGSAEVANSPTFATAPTNSGFRLPVLPGTPPPPVPPHHHHHQTSATVDPAATLRHLHRSLEFSQDTRYLAKEETHRSATETVGAVSDRVGEMAKTAPLDLSSSEDISEEDDAAVEDDDDDGDEEEEDDDDEDEVLHEEDDEEDEGLSEAGTRHGGGGGGLHHKSTLKMTTGAFDASPTDMVVEAPRSLPIAPDAEFASSPRPLPQLMTTSDVTQEGSDGTPISCSPSYRAANNKSPKVENGTLTNDSARKHTDSSGPGISARQQCHPP